MKFLELCGMERWEVWSNTSAELMWRKLRRLRCWINQKEEELLFEFIQIYAEGFEMGTMIVVFLWSVVFFFFKENLNICYKVI